MKLCGCTAKSILLRIIIMKLTNDLTFITIVTFGYGNTNNLFELSILNVLMTISFIAAKNEKCIIKKRLINYMIIVIISTIEFSSS